MQNHTIGTQHLFINQLSQQQILTDLLQRPSIEACGVFLGTQDADGWHVAEVRPLPNIFASPVYFEFDPLDLLAVEIDQPGRIIGVYHSHPTGFPRASDTDMQNMHRVNVEEQIPWAWLIVCGPFNTLNSKSKISDQPSIAYFDDARSGLQQLSVHFA